MFMSLRVYVVIVYIALYKMRVQHTLGDRTGNGKPGQS